MQDFDPRSMPESVRLAGLASLKRIAGADGQVDPSEKAFVAAVQKHILGTAVNWEDIPHKSASEIAAAVPKGPARERIFMASMTIALMDGDASKAEETALAELRTAFELEEGEFAVFQRLSQGQLLRARIDILRRSPPGVRIAETREQGKFWPAAISFFKSRFLEDKAMADKFRSLEALPKGTLGRDYFDFMRSNEFPLPGEKDGAPSLIMSHDCMHILGGYGTSAEEEMAVASFQAGFSKASPFGALLFGLAQFHLGLQVTPITAAETGYANPEVLLLNLQRGAQCTQDFFVGWEPWDHVETPVEELRARYNVVPRKA